MNIKNKWLSLTTRTGVQQLKEKFSSFVFQFPQKACEIENSERCSGNIVKYSSDCHFCYDTDHCEDCRYGWYLVNQEKDVLDCSFSGGSDISYECMSLVDCHHTCFSNLNRRGSRDLFYCDNCFGTKNCFGCIGLRNQEYCILNKQYTKEEYEKLVAQIINKMKEDNEWGEFFPISMSPFAYNETIAQDYFPLDASEASKLGYAWRDKSEVTKNMSGNGLTKEDIPDQIDDVDESICQKILLCEESGRPFRIIPLELKLYKKLGTPLPTTHPDIRYAKRLIHRTRISLYKRKDSKTEKDIISIYPADAPFPVYDVDEYHQMFS